jgi:hypothetical protein
MQNDIALCACKLCDQPDTWRDYGFLVFQLLPPNCTVLSFFMHALWARTPEFDRFRQGTVSQRT